MTKILVSGSAGFIAGYIIEELLNNDYSVVGVDNYSKYGVVEKSYNNHPNYQFHNQDIRDEYLYALIKNCDYFIMNAASVGGIAYFHKFAYDLLKINEDINSYCFDAALYAHKNYKLKKIIVASSSMIYESTNIWPSKEGDEQTIPPPLSTYGFQKLAMHYWCKGAFEQYGLPYTIYIPFNCVGLGEYKIKSKEKMLNGNIELTMSHVIPDLVKKILLKQDPLVILGSGSQYRHYTHGEDIARGVLRCLSMDNSIVNESFNLATDEGHTVLELAKKIWEKINGNKEFRYVSDAPFYHDVQKRIPDVSKSREVLNWEAEISLDESLDEIIPWIDDNLSKGLI